MGLDKKIKKAAKKFEGQFRKERDRFLDRPDGTAAEERAEEQTQAIILAQNQKELAKAQEEAEIAAIIAEEEKQVRIEAAREKVRSDARKAAAIAKAQEEAEIAAEIAQIQQNSAPIYATEITAVDATIAQPVDDASEKTQAKLAAEETTTSAAAESNLVSFINSLGNVSNSQKDTLIKKLNTPQINELFDALQSELSDKDLIVIMSRLDKEETQKLFESGQLSKEILCNTEQYELFMAKEQEELDSGSAPVISVIMDDATTQEVDLVGNTDNADMPADPHN